MLPLDCPKYEKCSAPLCPLDKNWRLRSYGNEDRICFYMTEGAKPSAAEIVPAEILAKCREMEGTGDLPANVVLRLKASALKPSKSLRMRQRQRARRSTA